MQYELGIIPKPINTKEKCCKTIFNPAIARRLLRLGNKIVDIKPNKDNPLKTLFIFEVNEKFNRDLKSF